MVEEIDVWRAANFYVGQFGKQAVHLAGMKADDMAEGNDLAGVRFWHQVIQAIQVLQSKKRPPDEPLH